MLDPLMESLGDHDVFPQLTGHMAVCMYAPGAGGKASKVRVLTESMRVHPSEEDPAGAREVVARAVLEALAECEFPASETGEDTFIVLPLQFE